MQLKRLTLQRLEDRRLMAADGDAAIGPLGATGHDTAEYMLGRVAVTPVLFESNGGVDANTENWTAEEIDAVLGRIDEAMQWWTDTLDQLGTVHELEFVIDDTFARTPFETGYEPIARRSQDHLIYGEEFLTAQGYDDFRNIDDAIFAFNDDQRQRLQTDWSFTIFVANSQADADGFFPSASNGFRGAFAFAGGLYFVMPSTRPVQTITHETGHIFWAQDEYISGDSYDERRGYYNTLNSNAQEDRPATAGVQQISIMAGLERLQPAFEQHVSPAATLALIGWQDSDGDGVFDVLDVPPKLTGVGLHDIASGRLSLRGTASVGTLTNQNSEGPQSDISISRITGLQSRTDAGLWQTIATFDDAVVDFDIDVAIGGNFETLQVRAFDNHGQTSEPLEGLAGGALLPGAGFSAFGFVDTDGDNRAGAGERTVPLAGVTLRRGGGEPLAGGSIAASDLLLDQVVPPTAGMTLATQFNKFAVGEIEVRTSESLDVPTFHFRNPQVAQGRPGDWTDRINAIGGIQVNFELPVGVAEVDVVGLQADAHGRVEALDADGNVISRVTTDARNVAGGRLTMGQSQTLRLTDPSNRIASIRVSGHAGTTVALVGVRHGIADVALTPEGLLVLPELPDGVYELTARSASVIQSFGSEPLVFEVNGGVTAGGPLSLAATRVDSPRYNAALPGDVNGDGQVTAVDALTIINDLNRLGVRTLSLAETTGAMVDVSNDGNVSALDALRVINALNAEDGGGQPEPDRGIERPADRSQLAVTEPAAEAFDVPVEGARLVSANSAKAVADPVTLAKGFSVYVAASV